MDVLLGDGGSPLGRERDEPSLKLLPLMTRPPLVWKGGGARGLHDRKQLHRFGGQGS